ncbi:hypothetical protein [Streptomyces sp. NPDC046805]|uniref:hypothetical protein n=1 Tax=Streptomyces sp. NPDC046805 TaxID=3155134 RepID=UPI0033E2F690
MGSLRNPVGPLPSSIYWRRRAVMLSVVAVLALLTTWIVTAGGGGGKNGADGSNGKDPASTITPGPSESGPVISQHPGGRDESGGGGSGGGGGDGSGSGDGGSDATGGNGSSGSGDGSGDGSGEGSGGSGGSGTGTGATIAASSGLPNCTSGSVSLKVRSKQNSYSPDQRPAFELTAKNASSGDCKIDLGPKGTVLTITQADADDEYWDSSDCPEGPSSLLYRVPAGSSVTYTVTWDRRPSATHCATPPAGSAGAGTYLVEAAAPGLAKAQTSFVLAAD